MNSIAFLCFPIREKLTAAPGSMSGKSSPAALEIKKFFPRHAIAVFQRSSGVIECGPAVPAVIKINAARY